MPAPGRCILVAAVAAIASVGGCGNEDPGETYKTCASGADCNTRLDRCERIPESIIGLCTRRCATSADCPEGDPCVSDVTLGLEAVCAKACSSADVCPDAMSCFRVEPGVSACLPVAWVG